MKSSCLIASGALLLVGLAPGCNEILGTTRGTPEGAGGSSTASSSASSGTGGAPFSTGTGGGTSAASSTSGDGGSASASSSSAGGGSSVSVSTSASTGSGPCTTDEDGDGVISWQCAGGKDCADQDKRAHPGADFTAGAAISGPRSPGTLPYDFNCDGTETKQTPVLACIGAICATPATTKGFQQDESCGAPGMLGHCAGTTPCTWVSDSAVQTQICK